MPEPNKITTRDNQERDTIEYDEGWKPKTSSTVTQLVFESEDYKKLYDPEAEREHGANENLITYYREGDKPQDEICITVDESEGFELDTEIDLNSDVLEPSVFDALLTCVRDGFNVYDVPSVLTRAGLPVKRCGLNADWCCRAWHLSQGEPNQTSGDTYLLDTEETNDAGEYLYQVVRRHYNIAGGDMHDTIIVPTASLVDVIAAYKALPKCHDCRKPAPLREYEKDNLTHDAVLHIEICEDCREERTPRDTPDHLRRLSSGTETIDCCAGTVMHYEASQTVGEDEIVRLCERHATAHGYGIENYIGSAANTARCDEFKE